MSLTHEFYLLDSHFDLSNRYEWYGENRYTWPERSVISDVIIQYMMDFLNWIPTYNPETKKSHNGLNYYGMTVIEKSGAEKLVEILVKWVELFKEAPSQFSLKGDIVWKEDENGEGYWEQTRVWINHKTMLNEVQELINLVIKAVDKNEMIIHFGI